MPLKYDCNDLRKARDAWGANCGPGAIAAMAGCTLEDVRPLLMPKFARLKGTTEMMMREALIGLGVAYDEGGSTFPDYGIVRVQWDGPWIGAEDPYERYRHSHWVGCHQSPKGLQIFDFNALSVGGWLPFEEWRDQLVPWLLMVCEGPAATGKWWIIDCFHLRPTQAREETSS